MPHSSIACITYYISKTYLNKYVSQSAAYTAAYIKRNIYKYLTKDIEHLSYKSVSKRNSTKEQILEAIDMLETGKYTYKDICEKTGLTRSTVEKIAYHQRWTELTEGKTLRFKGSK